MMPSLEHRSILADSRLELTLESPIVLEKLP
jgi:hypothetical protein